MRFFFLIFNQPHIEKSFQLGRLVWLQKIILEKIAFRKHWTLSFRN